MLPPVESETLSGNPRFDALYRDLCNNKLNADGTTKYDAKTQKERDSFSEELKKARVAAAKQNLIKTYLSSLAYRADGLPAELQELTITTAAALCMPLSREDAALLYDDIERFKDNIILISLVVSKAAAEDMTSLARILTIGSPSPDTTHWRDLPSQIANLHLGNLEKETTISSLHRELVHEASVLHSSLRTVLEISVQILERTIHGSVSRSTKAKADYLSTVAEGMAKKLQLQQNSLLAKIRAPKFMEALTGREQVLEKEEMSLRRKVREAEGKLLELKGSVLEHIAREYAELASELTRVEGDIERFESTRKR